MLSTRVKSTKPRSTLRSKPALVSSAPETEPNIQQAIDTPQLATPADIIALQQSAGNQAVAGLLGSARPMENASGSAGGLSPAFATAVQQSRGSGMALPPVLRQELETSLQGNFSKVRLHTDDQADRLSQQISAKAFTIGSDVFFRQGAFNPHTAEGRHTLQHELTHVVQQGGRVSSSLRLGPVNDVHEQAAERISQGGKPSFKNTIAPSGSVQRIRFPWEKKKPSTAPSIPDTSKLTGDPNLAKVGENTLNSVWKRDYGGGSLGFYKPNAPDKPDMAAKSVLSSRVDQLLGHNLLSRESYANYGNKGEGGESGVVPGKKIKEDVYGPSMTEEEFVQNVGQGDKQIADSYIGMGYNRVGDNKIAQLIGPQYRQHDYSNTDTQRDLSNIQMQDAITGQSDRHDSNLTVIPGGGARAYDNDQITSDTDVSQIKNLNRGLFNTKNKRSAARRQAFDVVNKHFGKTTGLPSHVDEATAQRLAQMKSKDFMSSLTANKNVENVDKKTLNEIKERYKVVRRYAKAGLGQAGIGDSKWATPKYQQEAGLGSVPTIVRNNQWNMGTYQAQMNEPRHGDVETSYLQRAATGLQNFPMTAPTAPVVPTPAPTVAPPVNNVAPPPPVNDVPNPHIAPENTAPTPTLNRRSSFIDPEVFRKRRAMWT